MKAIEKIRKEIERRMNNNLKAEEKYNNGLFGSAAKEDYDLLSFLDTIEEPVSEELEKVVMIDNVIMNMTAEGYNNGYKTRPFYEEVLRRLNARKEAKK